MRRADESRNNRSRGFRQEKTLARRRRRGQHDEFARPRRQEEQRGSGRRRIARPPKHHNRTVDDVEFLRRRRRDAEIDERKIRWPFERRADHGQPAPRIPSMGPVGVTAEIGPVGWRRVVEDAVTPDDFFAAHGEHGGNPLRKCAGRIQRQKLLVAFHRIERDHRRVSILDARIAADGFAAQIGDRRHVRHARRVRHALGDEERLTDLRCVPGDLAAVCQFAHSQSRAREQVVETEAAGSDHFRQRSRVSAVGSGLIRSDRAGSRVEGDRDPVAGIDERQSARHRFATAGERIFAALRPE